jgi:alpha-beta hydrolase superfamily lysophospholipase
MAPQGKAHGYHRWICLPGLVALPAIALLGGTWLVAYLTLHPITRSTGASPADWPALNYQEISFTTADGLLLRGWYLPGRGDAVVIMVHGFARDRSELLPEARWLVERGYAVLLFDLRAHGSSDGSHIGLGYLEALDVVAAVDYALARSPQQRVGVIGYSLGGVAAIHAASKDTRIEAVVAVSPFANLRDTVSYRLSLFRPLAPLVVWWGEQMTGLRLHDVQPTDWVAWLPPRPILIMQAGGDEMVPLDSGQRLFSAAGEPKELWSVPGVAHVDFRQALPETYKQRILDFLERYLPLRQ